MERVWSTSGRGFSVRSIFMFVLTVFITALLWVAFGSHTPTHAIDGPTATWKGESMLYDGHQYFSAGDVKSGDSIGLPQGTHYYLYTPDSSGTAPATQKAFVIYFAPGTDPPTEKTATFITYDYSSQKVFSNPSGKKDINVTPRGQENNSVSSCTVDGIGWIICPITTFLADGMDNIFNFVKGFLVVQPANTTNAHNDLYISWDIMRSIANVAFIIVFLIIIYSQLTSVGISNYGLKKLLPRLIIAAVLVNLSYYICAIALDISNILGYSLQDIFINIRQSTFNITNDTWSNQAAMTWQGVAAFVLSGGAASVGILAATGGTIAGAIYLLVPILLGALLTILMVLLILAARQAIIIILIVIAPLAFVAYLLPNTEEWFKKWRELFMTMLVFFPAFSLVFGGSQLAGGIIIQNATSIIGVIFGLAVQVAPLVITPLILKLSGGLLGRIAGMVNNPKKGLLDRTKAWSGARAEMHRQRGIGGELGKKNVFRRTARRMALADNRVERNTNRYKAGFEAEATRHAISTRAGQKIEVASALAKEEGEELTHNLEQAMQELRAGDTSGLRRLRTIGEHSTVEDFRMSRLGGALTGGRLTEEDIVARRERRIDGDKGFGKYALKSMERAVEMDQASRAIKNATAVAENIQVTNYAKQIETNAHNLRTIAGGIAGERGQSGALAAAFKAQAEAHNTAVANANSIMSHYNYSDDKIVEIALAQGGVAPAGVHFDKVSDALKEAAIMKVASGGNAGAILKLMKNIEIDESPENQDFRQAFADALLTNSAKPKFAGAGIIADLKQGVRIARDGSRRPIPTPGDARIDTFILETIAADKFGSADTLVTQDRDYLEALEATLKRGNNLATIDPIKKATILKSIGTIRKNPLYSGKVGERKNAIDSIEAMLSRDPETVASMRDPAVQEVDESQPAGDE